jgi:hypothetical protein
MPYAVKVAARPKRVTPTRTTTKSPASRASAQAQRSPRSPQNSWLAAAAAECDERLFVERCFLSREETHTRTELAMEETHARRQFAVALLAEESAAHLWSLHERALQDMRRNYGPGSDLVLEAEREIGAQIASMDREIACLQALSKELHARDADREEIAGRFRQRIQMDRESVRGQVELLESEEAKLRGQSLDEFLRRMVPARARSALEIREFQTGSPSRRASSGASLVAYVAKEISAIVTAANVALVQSASAISESDAAALL